MLKRLLIGWLLVGIYAVDISAQTEWVEQKQDITTDEELANWRELYIELEDLSNHPFNINTITKEQLEQLPFLSDRMVENILYYIYKYGPMLTKNELLGIEGMDRQTRHFLQDFIYIGPSSDEEKWLSAKNVMKYGQHQLLTRVDIPLNKKAGYADYDEETLMKYPNRKYAGSSLYNHVRYTFGYGNKIAVGVNMEKDSGEPFFSKYNRKGYDFYSGYVLLQGIKHLKTGVLGHYKANFGYGLTLNTGAFFGGKYNMDVSVHRFGRGFSPHSSMNESSYLQGAAFTHKISANWEISALYSYKMMDARVEDMFIRSFKTDGYHRTQSDMEKKNTVSNQLVGSNIAYKNDKFEILSTLVYTHFNKLLNPDEKPYNIYYPRGKDFFNAGVSYKVFMNRFILSGETAFDKSGKIATLHILSYSPSVNTSLFFINRYFDKKYQAIYADSPFCESAKLQNEVGTYIGLNANLLDRKLRLNGYCDIFHFFHRRYKVDKEHTSGVGIVGEVSYSPVSPLSMLIKYSMKNKAENHVESDKEKYVLPYVKHRLSYQLNYSPAKQVLLKAGVQYIRSGFNGREQSNGLLCNGTLRFSHEDVPVRASLLAAWFKTDDYASRIYMYEPGLSYAFSMPSFYGKGCRYALNLQYAYKNRVVLQGKWGYTRYADRDKIGTGTEEIQGNKKADVQFQIKVKW